MPTNILDQNAVPAWGGRLVDVELSHVANHWVFPFNPCPLCDPAQKVALLVLRLQDDGVRNKRSTTRAPENAARPVRVSRRSQAQKVLHFPVIQNRTAQPNASSVAEAQGELLLANRALAISETPKLAEAARRSLEHCSQELASSQAEWSNLQVSHGGWGLGRGGSPPWVHVSLVSFFLPEARMWAKIWVKVWCHLRHVGSWLKHGKG